MYMRKLILGSVGSYVLLTAIPAFAAGACPPAGGPGAALLERYVNAVNAHDTGPFPEIFTESYIQHSGRSPSGLAAQVENFKRIVASMPDLRIKVEDCIVSGDKLVARTTYSATHTQAIRGIAPTGKAFSFRTIDIWRVENGKLAEHWDLTDAGDVIQKLKSE
jgi:steroid delta-isomerase-like uncharacterized protein